jgi:transcriptional regulator with XRE-family HTH domain
VDTETTTLTLREARLWAGLGRMKCARLAGIDAPSLGRYEAGKVRPGLSRAIRIAEVLGVPAGRIEEFIPAVREVEAAGLVLAASEDGRTNEYKED